MAPDSKPGFSRPTDRPAGRSGGETPVEPSTNPGGNGVRETHLSPKLYHPLSTNFASQPISFANVFRKTRGDQSLPPDRAVDNFSLGFLWLFAAVTQTPFGEML
jgi:hypothetical protein